MHRSAKSGILKMRTLSEADLDDLNCTKCEGHLTLIDRLLNVGYDSHIQPWPPKPNVGIR